MSKTDQIAELASLISAASTVVAFTGAGISTESGIPDFRSPGGVWTKYDPADFTYQKYVSSENTRRLSWQRFGETGILQAEPNLAHYALADLQNMGKLQRIITQNVDNLHQKAGSPPDTVIELHGTYNYTACLDCGARYPSSEILALVESGVAIPACPKCGGMLKVAAISFGQAMPEREVAEAERWSEQSDLFIVVGSSLVVFPAAEMPTIAWRNGAKLVIINLEPTYADSMATLIVREKAGEFLPLVVESIEQATSK